MAMAYRQREAKRCGQCGTFPDSWKDDNGRLAKPPPWETEPHRCEGCRTLAEANDEIKTLSESADGPAVDTSGVTVRWVRPPDAPHDQ